MHVSAMSRTFVKDPRDAVRPGDVVRVKVLAVDVPRKRISLTLRLDDEPARPEGKGRPDAEAKAERGPRPNGQRPARKKDRPQPAPQTAMADALRRAGLTDR